MFNFNNNLSEITVLYCEDEQELREATQVILENFTFKQYIAVDGQEGLNLFKEHQDEIDLIVTDVNMPHINGLEMAKQIKEINPDIPIIVATAFSNSDYLLEAIDIGIDKYVLKPVDIKKLLEVMNQSLLYHELRNLYIDSMTKLPNRNAFVKDNQEKNEALLMLVDIDKFSVVNDLYGEAMGDQILVQFADKLKQYFPNDKYKIYRVGADKFLIWCQDYLTLETELKLIAKQLIDDIEENGIKLANYEIYLGVTAAIAKSDDQHTYEYTQRVLQKARKQYMSIMIYDKDAFVEYSNYEENIKWIKELKHNSQTHRFKPYFQPIIDALTQEVYKYESLIRYIDEDGNEVAPYKFLPIAKKAKLFPIIMNIMLQGAIDIIKEKNIKVSVNVSYDDIINEDTLMYIYGTLKTNPAEAQMLDFEILESEEIENFEYVREFIKKVRECGSQVGIDDFGAGYSNFNMLEELNIDFVKIDGSLIKNIDHLPKQALIVETISNFCQKLGIKTVAEFVSSKEIYEKVKSLDINYIQGWYFGKAQDGSKI
jgi:diguanylate cyclase (GGDEF)-like protein